MYLLPALRSPPCAPSRSRVAAVALAMSCRLQRPLANATEARAWKPGGGGRDQMGEGHGDFTVPIKYANTIFDITINLPGRRREKRGKMAVDVIWAMDVSL